MTGRVSGDKGTTGRTVPRCQQIDTRYRLIGPEVVQYTGRVKDRAGGNDMFYEVSKEVFEKLPTFVVGVVAVTGIDNSRDVPAITKMLEENAEAVRKYFEESGNKAKNDP